MRTLLENNDATGFRLLSGTLLPLTRILTADYVIDPDGPIGQFLDPGGSDRIVTLPLIDEGLFFYVVNQGSNTLTVKNSSGTTVEVLNAGVANVFYTNGQSWSKLVVATSVFGPVGPNHSIGLVPDPGPTPGPAVRFLGDDGAWHGALGGSLLDGYSFITDGTNTAAGTGNDTFRLRTSAKLTVVVTDNDVTFGDNALFDVVEAAIDHNALLNFVANKHIDHTAVSISAGSGLSGGGDISASRTLALDINGLALVTPAVGDFVPFYDISGTVNGKMTVTTLSTVIDHNTTLNYVADQHVAHSGVSINAGTGLSGGGTIAASRTLSLDINGLGAISGSLAAGDFFAVYDVSVPGHVKVSFSTLNSNLDHNALTNYVADQHVAHSGVTLTAGIGLTGGGTIAASRTIALDVSGLSIIAPAVGDFLPFYDISGTTHGKITFTTLSTVVDHNTTINYIADQHVAHSGVTLTAGAGLTGGGDISASRTFDIGAGTGIVVNANDVAIDAATTTEVLTGTSVVDVVTPDAMAALWEKGANVASAGTVSLGEGGFFHITGTTTITDIDWATAKDGRVAFVTFDGALTLTHNATTLKLPNNGANITTAAGDRAIFVQDSGDNVICLFYQKADGTALQGGGGISDGDKGDITVSGSGATWTIDNDVVTFAKMQNIATARFVGRTTAASGDPEELTGTQATALLDNFVGDSGSGGTKGLVPAPASGDGAAGKVLKADGTWGAGATWTLVNKSSDTTRNTTTATSADPALQFSLAANTTYAIRIVVKFRSTAAGDFKWKLSGPASPTEVYGATTAPSYNATTIQFGGTGTFEAYPSDTALVGTAAGASVLAIELTVENGANSGTFSFDWAQNTSDAGPTTVKAGSYIEYRTY